MCSNSCLLKSQQVPNLILNTRRIDWCPSSSRSPIKNTTNPQKQFNPDTRGERQSCTAVSWIAEVRKLLKSIIERQGLVTAPPAASAAWLVQTKVDLMLNVVEELRPERMRGYGELSGDACRELEGIISDLRRQFLKLTDTIC